MIIIRFLGNPVLILKGTCNESPLDWLFYIEKDENMNIFYEGYRSSKIILINGLWHIESSQAPTSELSIDMEAGQDASLIPLGRRSWQVLNTACGLDKKQEKYFSISICIFEEEFSCFSGECVNLFQRCDNNMDCSDGSDEEDCNMIRVPPSYEKSSSPELSRELMEANPIFTQINILNIDFIDTVRMSVGITVEIHLTWRDPKLIYENILDGRATFESFRVLAKREIEMIWLPMPEVIHDNAIIGKVQEDKIFSVKVVGQSLPEKMSLDEDIEALLYDGAKNNLLMSQRFKLEYRCDFFLSNYPFDEQTCNFVLMMNLKGNNSIKLAEHSSPIIYIGPSILREFELTDLLVNTSLTEFETRFIYSIRLERLYMQAVSTTFFQSFLLWVIAYFTLYINITDFTNRFMGALTSLLVLAALLSSINSSLPKTAYFKHVDIWFFCFIMNIVIIIFVHIIVDFFLNQEKDFSVQPLKITSMSMIPMGRSDLRKPALRKKSKFLNKWSKLVIPIQISFFLVIYFEITTSN